MVVTTLNVDPGGYWPRIARAKPPSGWFTAANTPPVVVLMATRAAGSPIGASAVSPARWIRRSSVVVVSVPATGGKVFSVCSRIAPCIRTIAPPARPVSRVL